MFSRSIEASLATHTGGADAQIHLTRPHTFVIIIIKIVGGAGLCASQVCEAGPSVALTLLNYQSWKQR
jgi:hypothetical protein